jgi:hypothetical protein
VFKRFRNLSIYWVKPDWIGIRLGCHEMCILLSIQFHSHHLFYYERCNSLNLHNQVIK